jgi:endonuclease/exonuclease/phosphatase family metal-dependent hydrolase
VRVATFNVLHGRSPADGVVDPARLRAAVVALRPDVLGLQEVDRNQPRSGGFDLVAEAAAALGGADFRFAPAILGTPGEQWCRATAGAAGPAGGPAYGIGLVSRLPVVRWAVLTLPPAPVPTLLPVFPPPGGGRVRVEWLRDEQRVLLAAVLDGPAGPLTVATTHLSFVQGWNVLQLRRAVRALRRLPAPRILLGDLNMPGPVPTWATGWRRLAVLPTFPAWNPRMQIDHVLTDSATVSATSARSPAAALSDHRAVVVELADSDARLPGAGSALDLRHSLDEPA